MSGTARPMDAAESVRADVARRFGEVRVILAPPRTCSTLLSRALWGSPGVSFYAHEPFDVIYHKGLGLADVGTKLLSAVPVTAASAAEAPTDTGLLVKELSFQVGRYFSLLASFTRHQIVVLIRDPRLAIASRMRMRAKGGQDPVFPPIESGWTWLADQVQQCRASAIRYAVLDAVDLLSEPARRLAQVCDALALPFDQRMLHWQPARDVDLQLSLDEQRHWNDRVLGSTGFEPARDEPMSLDDFPLAGGMRAHVRESLEIYETLRDDPARLR